MKKLSDAVDDVPSLRAMQTWTEEQWALHDARLAASSSATVAEPARGFLSVAAGWPRRNLSLLSTIDESKPAVVQLKSWDRSSSPIVVLSGGVGCGKTIAATWWADTYAPKAMFVTSAEFARTSRYSARRDEWVEAPALVFDDLGAEYADDKGALLADLEELVDKYYADCKPLLITTNLGVDAFKQRFGQRISDRIREAGQWLSVKGESLRG